MSLQWPRWQKLSSYGRSCHRITGHLITFVFNCFGMNINLTHLNVLYRLIYIYIYTYLFTFTNTIHNLIIFVHSVPMCPCCTQLAPGPRTVGQGHGQRLRSGGRKRDAMRAAWPSVTRSRQCSRGNPMEIYILCKSNGDGYLNIYIYTIQYIYTYIYIYIYLPALDRKAQSIEITVDCFKLYDCEGCLMCMHIVVYVYYICVCKCVCIYIYKFIYIYVHIHV